MSDESNAVDDVVAEALAEAQSQVSDLQGEVDAVTGLDARMQTGIDMLGDVDLQVTVELGRTEMLVEDVLRLGNGSVVELDKLAGDPVDVFVNGRLVARGEVLVLNDNFCIRISEIVAGVEDALPADAEVAIAPASSSGEG
ncbi:flagellar motor switch protein FliN [Phycisphaeraceae bacterium D3-23]